MPRFEPVNNTPDTAAEGQAKWERQKAALMLHGRVAAVVEG